MTRIVHWFKKYFASKKLVGHLISELEFYKTTFVVSQDIKLVLDGTTKKLIRCNKTAVDFFGLSEDDLFDSDIEKLLNIHINGEDFFKIKTEVNNYVLSIIVNKIFINGKRYIFLSIRDISDIIEVQGQLKKSYTTIQEDIKRQATISEIAYGLYEAESFEDIGNVLVKNLKEYSVDKKVIGFKLGVYDSNSDTYQIVSQTVHTPFETDMGLMIPTGKRLKLKEIQYFSKKAIDTKSTLIIQDNHSPESLKIDSRHADTTPHAMIFIPLYFKGDLVGLISFARTPIYSMDDDFISFLDDISKYVAISIGERLLRNRMTQMYIQLHTSEKALKLSEEKFQRAFDYSPIAKSIISASDLKFVNVNQAFIDTLGYTREELIGVSSDDLKLFNKHDIENFQQSIILKRPLRDYECKIYGKNNIYDAIVYVEFFESSTGLNIITAGIDITKRKQIEADLATAKGKLLDQYALLDSMINNLPIQILYKNTNHEMVLVNQRTVEGFNKLLNRTDLTMSDLIGKTDKEIMGDKYSIDAEYYDNEEAMILVTGLPILNKAYTTINGIQIIYSKIPIYDDDNIIKGIVGIVYNLSHLLHEIGK